MTVTNHTVPVFGTLSVTKKITGATEGVRAGATFPITVACDNPAKGRRRLTTATTFDLTVNATVTTPELPVGTACTVTEGTLPATRPGRRLLRAGDLTRRPRTSPSAAPTRPPP